MTSSFSDSKFSEFLSRRDLLLRASSGVPMSLAGATLSAWGQSSQATAAADLTAQKSSISPASMPKSWSAEEFRRRWQGVRQGMKKNNFDCLIECRVCGKLQCFRPDRHWVVICHQHESALGLAHYFKPHRQSVRESSCKVIERRLFAGLQFQFDFRQRLSAIADNNEPFVESHLDQGPFDIETTQTPLDLRLKLLLE